GCGRYLPQAGGSDGPPAPITIDEQADRAAGRNRALDPVEDAEPGLEPVGRASRLAGPVDEPPGTQSGPQPRCDQPEKSVAEPAPATSIRTRPLSPPTPARVGGLRGGSECSSLHARKYPRFAVFAFEQFVRFLVADHLFPVAVPRQRAAQLLRNVAEDADRRRDVSLFDVGDRLAARADGGEVVLHVRAVGRDDVGIDFVLRFDDLDALGRFLGERRGELPEVEVNLQRALVAVEANAPRVFLVLVAAPGAVFPDEFEVAVVIGDGLSV